MPRGNLEGIYPRIIMLNKILEDIEAKRYGKAFRMLRQQKIDINIIYDANQEQFLDNISLFVSEMDEKIDFLNLFINSLVDDVRGPELEFMRPKDPEEVIRNEHKQLMRDQILTSVE
jgi:hypothetical protein